MCSHCHLCFTLVFLNLLLSTHKDHPNVCRTQPGIWAETALHAFHLWVFFQSACLLAGGTFEASSPCFTLLGAMRCPQAMHTAAQSARDEWEPGSALQHSSYAKNLPFLAGPALTSMWTPQPPEGLPNKVYYINTTNTNKVYSIKPQISRLAGLHLSFSELGMEEKGSLTSPILTPNSCLIFQK